MVDAFTANQLPMTQHPFDRLTPDFILNAVESTGLWSDARIYPLNSYENRVYQIGIEEGPTVVAKFYRPERWNLAQLQEEHAVLNYLKQSGIAVVAPMAFDGLTLLEHQGIHFCLSEKVLGQSPDADNMNHLFATGELLGEMHKALQSHVFLARPTLSPIEGIQHGSEIILNSPLFKKGFKSRYLKAISQLKQLAQKDIQAYWPSHHFPIHGDCHRSNLLIHHDQLQLLDFDDCMTGISMQDLWLHLSGDTHQQAIQLNELIEGYESFYDFNRQEMHLIDTLKAYRIVQQSAWVLTRWEDPAFPRAFPNFATEDYWLMHLQALEETILHWGKLAKQALN